MATTTLGPISTQQINNVFYVSEDAFTTIQAAVNYANTYNAGVGHVVIVQGTYTEAINTVVNGTPGIYITDRRNAIAQDYVWSGSAFIPADFVQLGRLIAASMGISGEIEAGSISASAATVTLLTANNAEITGDVTAATIHTPSLTAGGITTGDLTAENITADSDIAAATIHTPSLTATDAAIGTLTLAQDPTQPEEAATKNYVDEAIAESGNFVYPAAGVTVSTGTAWDTSINPAKIPLLDASGNQAIPGALGVAGNIPGGTINTPVTGIYFAYNLSGGNGEGDIVSCGGGGVRWYASTPGKVLNSSTPYSMFLAANGDLYVSGTLYAAIGANVGNLTAAAAHVTGAINTAGLNVTTPIAGTPVQVNIGEDPSVAGGANRTGILSFQPNAGTGNRGLFTIAAIHQGVGYADLHLGGSIGGDGSNISVENNLTAAGSIAANAGLSITGYDPRGPKPGAIAFAYNAGGFADCVGPDAATVPDLRFRLYASDNSQLATPLRLSSGGADVGGYLNCTGALTVGAGTAPPLLRVGGQALKSDTSSPSIISASGTLQLTPAAGQGLYLNVYAGDYIYFCDAGGAGAYNALLTKLGAFTCTSLSVSGAKNFKIPHPHDETKWLTHSCLEGPEIALFYRGESKTVKGVATIALPDYFETMARPEGRTVQLTQIFESETDGFAQLMAGRVIDGQFQVRSSAPSAKFCWEVKAVRADLDPLEVVRDRREGDPETLVGQKQEPPAAAAKKGNGKRK